MEVMPQDYWRSVESNRILDIGATESSGSVQGFPPRIAPVLQVNDLAVEWKS